MRLPKLVPRLLSPSQGRSLFKPSDTGKPCVLVRVMSQQVLAEDDDLLTSVIFGLHDLALELSVVLPRHAEHPRPSRDPQDAPLIPAGGARTLLGRNTRGELSQRCGHPPRAEELVAESSRSREPDLGGQLDPSIFPRLDVLCGFLVYGSPSVQTCAATTILGERRGGSGRAWSLLPGLLPLHPLLESLLRWARLVIGFSLLGLAEDAIPVLGVLLVGDLHRSLPATFAHATFSSPAPDVCFGPRTSR